MRDRNDNVVVVCSIENLDPMGVHTGDSITVAPAMTLTDREYQRMRDLGIAIMREVGVDTGGCNIQFAVDPADGRLIVIEMNPRVSRSSALASKATGFPIAKIAAKLAIGYTLDEILNDITKETPACFEPTLDYVVVKAPRFAFEKFPGADPTLTTTMKSVGEAMAIGPQLHRGAAEGDALAGDDATPASGPRPTMPTAGSTERAARRGCARPPTAGSTTSSRRCGSGASVEQVARGHRHRPLVRRPDRRCWSRCARELVEAPGARRRAAAPGQATRPLRPPDRRAAAANSPARPACAALRQRLGIHPVFKTVDTCAAEFDAKTPYHYSLRYDEETEVAPQTEKPKVLILGSGPNRIGQGIEFDYCCVHAATDAERGRLRDRDGQLQPRDGLHRLRHRRPAVLRAADLRGRARGRTTPSSAGRRRSSG